jgi:hypothetical protein
MGLLYLFLVVKRSQGTKRKLMIMLKYLIMKICGLQDFEEFSDVGKYIMGSRLTDWSLKVSCEIRHKGSYLKRPVSAECVFTTVLLK